MFLLIRTTNRSIDCLRLPFNVAAAPTTDSAPIVYLPRVSDGTLVFGKCDIPHPTRRRCSSNDPGTFAGALSRGPWSRAGRVSREARHRRQVRSINTAGSPRHTLPVNHLI